MQKFIIKGRLDGLNEYTKANRGNKFGGNTCKKNNEAVVACFLHRLKPVSVPVKLIFKWYEPNVRRDVDNIAFAKKFICDCLVQNRILPNDNQQWVKGFTDEFAVDKINPRIEVEIIEICST